MWYPILLQFLSDKCPFCPFFCKLFKIGKLRTVAKAEAVFLRRKSEFKIHKYGSGFQETSHKNFIIKQLNVIKFAYELRHKKNIFNIQIEED